MLSILHVLSDTTYQGNTNKVKQQKGGDGRYDSKRKYGRDSSSKYKNGGGSDWNTSSTGKQKSDKRWNTETDGANKVYSFALSDNG